jgi:hypothetical protein
MREAENHYNLANDLLEKGLIDEALKELREAVKIYPEYAEAHLMLGIQLVNRNRDEAARELYEGIRLNPELFDKLIVSFENAIQNNLPGDEEAVRVLNLLKLLGSITKYINSDDRDKLISDETGKDYSEETEFGEDYTDASRKKNIDKKLAKEIIATALNVATKGKVEIEKITDIPPATGTMTAEKIQELDITKESLLCAFLSDPRVISAECKDGEFHIETVEGKISFNFKFEDEKTSGSA